MLGALAAIGLTEGCFAATVTVTENNRQVDEQVPEPVVEVQTCRERSAVLSERGRLPTPTK